MNHYDALALANRESSNPAKIDLAVSVCRLRGLDPFQMINVSGMAVNASIAVLAELILLGFIPA